MTAPMAVTVVQRGALFELWLPCSECRVLHRCIATATNGDDAILLAGVLDEHLFAAKVVEGAGASTREGEGGNSAVLSPAPPTIPPRTAVGWGERIGRACTRCGGTGAEPVEQP